MQEWARAPSRMDHLQGIDSHSAPRKSTPKGPRRAFKVTCAIQFSKSVRRIRLFRVKKADAESSLVWKGSQTTSFPEVYPSGTGNIGAMPGPVNPVRGVFSARTSRFITSTCAPGSPPQPGPPAPDKDIGRPDRLTIL